MTQVPGVHSQLSADLPKKAQNGDEVGYFAAEPEYLGTAGAKLRRGPDFTTGDTPGGSPVMIASVQSARQRLRPSILARG